MRLVLFGATGRVGKDVLKLALADGHEVTAFVRSADRLPQSLSENRMLKIHQGDVLNKSDVDEVMAGGYDLVFSALSTDKSSTLSKGVPHIINAMNKHGVNRFISIGTAGILQARSAPALYRFQSSESKRKSTAAAEEHLAVYKSLEKSTLDWIIFCPTYLPDGEATGNVIYELNRLPEKVRKISVGNTAKFSYTQMFNDSFTGHRIGIGEAE
ncbi:NAD(P)H-binding protein [Salipaludibacillus sp. CUR1]|uniref:NAD(P)-dependent oxidoreductase n=1 Tax=Salipaludibacillus sp. CUR1 TaxID=2820003 RepID=UPI001E4A1EDF|nr:NAD(P)H-binding protein [Salipaludibacillus sp. CUR1]MCE7793686.1 NAD(P)H-binding protein [Salipaludibacillus sp. CUR1]